MEDDPKKGRQPQKWMTTSKMDDDLKQGFKKRSSAQAPLAENGGQIRISQKWEGATK